MNVDLRSQSTGFRAGDSVVLARGTYQGTLGTFICLTADSNWAEIQEAKGALRTHPVTWLRHRPDGELNWSELLHDRT
jgi:hypothetical protein